MTKKRVNKISTLGSKITTVISVALVLLIVGVILSITALTHGAGDTLRSHVAVVASMSEGASADDIERLGAELAKATYTARTVYNSAEDIFQAEAADSQEILDLLGSNPFRAEYEIYLKPEYVNTDSIRAITESLTRLESVDEVYTQADVVDNLNAFLQRATLVLAAVGAIFLAIAVILLINTMSLVIYSRRFNIHTMQLVGATRAFIRRPFVRTGAWLGALSGLLASAVLCGLYWYVLRLDAGALLEVGWDTMAAISAAITALGTVLCALASHLATNRYVNTTYDKLYD